MKNGEKENKDKYMDVYEYASPISILIYNIALPISTLCLIFPSWIFSEKKYNKLWHKFSNSGNCRKRKKMSKETDEYVPAISF